MNSFATSTLTRETEVQTKLDSQTRLIPTYVVATVFASLCIAVGLLWDISWHMSIGRDGLLSPPHLAIYLGAVIAGTFSGFNVLRTSFWGSPTEKAKKIKFWGIFYASLGAMFCIWGAFAMLTSAPFDDWWHNTYGLDVMILSPPHAVLGLGMITVQFGALTAVMALQNRYKDRSEPKLQNSLRWLYALSSGFLLVMVYTMVSEYFFTSWMHNVLMYKIAMGVFPLFMVAISYASPWKWGATWMAVIYSMVMAAMVWILPLFPAEPLLSPVYNPITNFQPYHFPILLIVPALVIDLLVAKWKHRNKWFLAVVLSVGFLLVFFPAQWLMGDFLLTEPAKGWFFGRYSLPYFVDPAGRFRFEFPAHMVTQGWDLAKGLGIAAVIGILSCRLGLSWGNWMSQVKR
ncbi:hypothetical protein [Pararhodonellum marinum]|uniref:hypothetical protein n=1 Tax=Pararhodonellum marinum TaxID=2755358 RepID=UPI00188FC406|nr:hypothetical protein [Pararhodonellum marinum]